MASNPLDDNDPATRERIEKRAYHMWEEEGRPHGRHDEYWERARELVAMETAGATGQIKPEEAVEPVEEASIQENLGEFPDRFADQGEKTATPKAKATARLRKAAPLPAPTKKAAPEAKPVKPAKAGKAPAPAPVAPPATGKKKKPG